MTTRRTLLASAAAAPILASPLGSAQKASAQTKQGTFVLVHGGNAGAWIWRDVIRLLRADGHDVYATTATGLGDRAHLADAAIDLDVYINDVVNLLEYEDLHDVTLVGWSFGGMSITGVAERIPERLAQLVYLDATVPEDGQRHYDAEGFPDDVISADYRAGAEAGQPGFDAITPGLAEWVRGSAKDPAVADWVLDKLLPQPMLTWLQPIRLGNPAAAALPHVFIFFIFCTKDPFDSSARTVDRVQSEPKWRVVELADNHLAPINSPQLTADVLVSLL
jgi:pimeloyl-ACP methyl ester carboxylesterase